MLAYLHPKNDAVFPANLLCLSVFATPHTRSRATTNEDTFPRARRGRAVLIYKLRPRYPGSPVNSMARSAAACSLSAST